MTMNQKQEFAAALSDARSKLDVTQRDCALHCGVSVVSYQNWERGTSAPKPEKLALICDFLNLNQAEFE